MNTHENIETKDRAATIAAKLEELETLRFALNDCRLNARWLRWALENGADIEHVCEKWNEFVFAGKEELAPEGPIVLWNDVASEWLIKGDENTKAMYRENVNFGMKEAA